MPQARRWYVLYSSCCGGNPHLLLWGYRSVVEVVILTVYIKVKPLLTQWGVGPVLGHTLTH